VNVEGVVVNISTHAQQESERKQVKVKIKRDRSFTPMIRCLQEWRSDMALSEKKLLENRLNYHNFQGFWCVTVEVT